MCCIVDIEYSKNYDSVHAIQLDSEDGIVGVIDDISKYLVLDNCNPLTNAEIIQSYVIDDRYCNQVSASFTN